MMKRFLIIVEGEADKKFVSDYFHHLFQVAIPQNCIIHTGELSKSTGGYTKLADEINIVRMNQNTNQGGVNLVIFDADKEPDVRRKELETIREQHNVEYELFLLPNNKDKGELEDLLEKIINPNNKPIFDCWDNYEKELVKQDIPDRTPPPLTTPAKKTKIYGYLEALLFNNQKEQIKEKKRDYENALHWNLDTEYLEALKEFLANWLNDEAKK